MKRRGSGRYIAMIPSRTKSEMGSDRFAFSRAKATSGVGGCFTGLSSPIGRRRGELGQSMVQQWPLHSRP